jgi:hypothetical protein
MAGAALPAAPDHECLSFRHGGRERHAPLEKRKVIGAFALNAADALAARFQPDVLKSGAPNPYCSADAG